MILQQSQSMLLSWWECSKQLSWLKFWINTHIIWEPRDEVRSLCQPGWYLTQAPDHQMKDGSRTEKTKGPASLQRKEARAHWKLVQELSSGDWSHKFFYHDAVALPIGQMILKAFSFILVLISMKSEISDSQALWKYTGLITEALIEFWMYLLQFRPWYILLFYY